MTRFRRSGVAWDGQKWVIPKSLDSLLDAIEAWQPNPRPLDGTVASEGHDAANPNSDHSPDPKTGTGVVRAVDAGENEPEGEVLVEALRASKDKRIRYVIHEGKIFSSYDHPNGPAWTDRPYSGYNAHLTHVHVSLWAGQDNNGGAWNLDLGDIMANMQVIDIQKALNKAKQKGADGKVLKEDDIYGTNTEFALVNGFKGGLKGEPGKDGAPGKKGEPGEDGAPGKDGKPVTITFKSDAVIP